MLYRTPAPTAPKVLLIDIAPKASSESPTLGRYDPAILESNAEITEREAVLQALRLVLRAPDLLDRRPSGFRSDTVPISRFAPTSPGWPWLTIG